MPDNLSRSWVVKDFFRKNISETYGKTCVCFTLLFAICAIILLVSVSAPLANN